MKKNSFLTFLFSLIPGAGQMYLGLLKKGSVIMLSFFIIIGLISFLHLSALTVFLPVVWFYAFFDTFNLKYLSDEERSAIDQRFAFGLNDLLKRDQHHVLAKRHVLVGVICIFLGFYMLFDSVVRPYLYRISERLPWLYQMIYQLPTLVVAVVIVILGVYLIRGGKKTELPEDDYQEYVGDMTEEEGSRHE